MRAVSTFGGSHLEAAKQESGSGDLLVVLATVGFAFKGIWVRLAYQAGLSVIGLLAWRVTLATPLFWLVAMFLGRSRTVSQLQRSDWQRAVFCGLLFLFAAFADFAAVVRIGAGLSRIILFTFPAFVLLIESVRERRMPHRALVLAFVVAWSGLILVVAPSTLGALGGQRIKGILLSLACAISYSIYLVISQSTTRRFGAARFAAVSNSASAVALALLLPAVGGPRVMACGSAAFGWSALMAVLSTVLPFVLLLEGMARSGAARTSMVALIGPPITLAAAWLILGESFGPRQLAGAALVLASMTVLRRQRGPEASSRADRVPPVGR